jgi:hypothetical protein
MEGVMFFKGASVFTVLLFAVTMEARSAEFERRNTPGYWEQDSEQAPPHCDISVEGPIVKGDGEKFRDLLGSIGHATVCLNSPGGAYYGGLNIATLILERELRTKVEDGSLCYSACAIMFMAGNEYRW